MNHRLMAWGQKKDLKQTFGLMGGAGGAYFNGATLDPKTGYPLEWKDNKQTYGLMGGAGGAYFDGAALDPKTGYPLKWKDKEHLSAELLKCLESNEQLQRKIEGMLLCSDNGDGTIDCNGKIYSSAGHVNNSTGQKDVNEPSRKSNKSSVTPQ